VNIVITYSLVNLSAFRVLMLIISISFVFTHDALFAWSR